MGRARVADDGGEVVRHGPLRRPHRRGEPLGRTRVRPRDDPVVDGRRGDARVLERLGGGRGVGDGLGEHGQLTRVVGAEQRGGAVAAVALVAAAGEPRPDVGVHDQRETAALERRAQGARARAHGAEHVAGERPRVEAERRVDRRRVRLVEVGRERRGEEERVGPRLGCRAQRGTRRLDAERGRVLVVGRDRARSGAAGRAERGRDRLPVEAEVGDVDAVADEAPHGAPILPAPPEAHVCFRYVG